MLILAVFLVPIFGLHGETVDELNSKIREQQKKILELDKQIQEQRQKVLQVGAEKSGVQSVINQLEASRKKIQSSISQTQAEIKESELTIQKLGLEINTKEENITENQSVIAKSIRKINQLQSTSLLEVLLTNESTSRFWDHVSRLESFNIEVRNKINSLRDLNVELKEKQELTEEEKRELELQTDELRGEHQSVEATKQEKAAILKQVADKEKTYQQILDQKILAKKQFEQELTNFESQLKIILDKSAFPTANNSVLQWPVDNVRITQNFGGTEFAKTNPGIYGRPFHNGTDFGVPIGEKVKASLSGTIQGTGNTDAYPGCVSWGRWILVKHDNGLTTLYAHLSSTIVSPGQRVETGQTIGFSGNSGASTGPHLHFTLYASQGVTIRQFSEFKSGSGCAATGATTPTAPLDAYLNPMDYLPSL